MYDITIKDKLSGIFGFCSIYCCF